MRAVPVISLALALAAGACSSSIRMTHESTSYFERCYAADLDTEIAVEDKRRCWAAWLEHYTAGQGPDRIRYAEDRLAALTRGETTPPLGPTAAAATRTHGPVDAGVDAPTDAVPMDAAPMDAAPDTDASASTSADGGRDASVDAPADARDPNAPPPRRPWQRRPVQPPPPTVPSLGNSPCAPICNPRFQHCVARCGDRGIPCHKACKAEHQACMFACP